MTIVLSCFWLCMFCKEVKWPFNLNRFVLTIFRILHSAGSAQGELCRLFLMVHESCREYGATPSQYMSFLHVYTALFSRKQSQLTTRQQHLQVSYQIQYNAPTT